jgi:hypothetical protein
MFRSVESSIECLVSHRVCFKLYFVWSLVFVLGNIKIPATIFSTFVSKQQRCLCL